MMFISKKIMAVLAALTMVATSFVAMTTVSAADADLNVEYVTDYAVTGRGATEGDFAVRFTFNNIAEDKGLKSFQFSIDIPEDYLGIKDGSFYSLSSGDVTLKELCYSKSGSAFRLAFDGGKIIKGDKVGELTRYDFVLSADASLAYASGDLFEMGFYLADGMTYDKLPVGSFKLSNVVGGADLSVDAAELPVVNTAEIKSSVEPTTPEYVYNGKDTNWGAATFVGDYSTADDKAIAVKAEVKPGQKVVDGALVDNTYTGLVWKAVKADGTAVGYEQDGLSITGNGTYVFGLAIDGVSEAEVQTNGFGIAVK